MTRCGPGASSSQGSLGSPCRPCHLVLSTKINLEPHIRSDAQRNGSGKLTGTVGGGGGGGGRGKAPAKLEIG